MASLRMNPSSSPTGTVKRASSNTKKTAGSGVPVLAAATVQVEPKEEKKYIHVHKFKNTNLFGAWFNDPSVEGKKVRLFFGSHRTAYLAARAQDRAALKYRPSALNPKKIKLNFKEEDYALDEGLRATMKDKEFGDLLRSESRPTYKIMEPTPLLRYFMAEERAAGNLPRVVPNEAKPKEVILLEPYLIDVIMKRIETEEIPDLSFLKEAYKEAYEALSLKGIQDPFLKVRAAAPNAKSVNHGAREKRKKCRRGVSPAGREEERNKRPRQEMRFVPMKLRNVAALNEPRTLRSSSAKRLATTPIPTVAGAKPKSVKKNIKVKLVWFPQRPRSELPTRLASRIVTEFIAPGNARNKLQYKLQKVDITRASELTLTASLPAQVEEAVPMVEELRVPEVEEMVPEMEEMVPEVEEMVPQMEEMVLEVEEMVPEVQEKESRAMNFNLFMLADVLALQES